MRFARLLTVISILSLPLVVGCGFGSVSGPVADHDSIAAYVAENPNSDAGTEPEGGDK